MLCPNPLGPQLCLVLLLALDLGLVQELLQDLQEQEQEELQEQLLHLGLGLDPSLQELQQQDLLRQVQPELQVQQPQGPLEQALVANVLLEPASLPSSCPRRPVRSHLPGAHHVSAGTWQGPSSCDVMQGARGP